MFSFLAFLLGGLAAAGCLAGAFFNFRRKRLIDDTPTSKAQGVFIGLTELKGTAESETPFTSYLAGTSCVYYTWDIEEHWSRTVTETYRDAQGHMQTRTKTETGWTNVAKGGESAPFYLKDDTSVIRIAPEGAKIHGNSVFNQTFGRDNPLYFGKGPEREIANTTHRRRFQETAVPLHTPLYVIGQARERDDVVAAEIAHDKNSPLFLISTHTENQISSGYGRWFWLFFALGLLISLGAAAGWSLAQVSGTVAGALPFILAGVVYLSIMVLIWLWLVYNSLIGLRNRVDQSWSQIDVQLKRRHDLIPNLVGSVQGYQAHEKDSQTLLTALRSQNEATPSGVAGPDYQGLASLLRVAVERYPELKADQSFLKLQESLVETEQRIALARDYYNDATTFYNTRLEIIPDRFVAVLARLQPKNLMSAAGFERAPVQVNLAT